MNENIRHSVYMADDDCVGYLSWTLLQDQSNQTPHLYLPTTFLLFSNASPAADPEPLGPSPTGLFLLFSKLPRLPPFFCVKRSIRSIPAPKVLHSSPPNPPSRCCLAFFFAASFLLSGARRVKLASSYSRLSFSSRRSRSDFVCRDGASDTRLGDWRARELSGDEFIQSG